MEDSSASYEALLTTCSPSLRTLGHVMSCTCDVGFFRCIGAISARLSSSIIVIIVIIEYLYRAPRIQAPNKVES